MTERVLSSPYMNWAKLESHARYNLAASGIMNCRLADLGPLRQDLELHGPNSYGYAPFVDRIAERFGIEAACVVTSQGASMSNHLAFAALIEPGDEVLVEEPTYELMLSAIRYLGADVRRLQRRAEAGFALEPEAVAEAITPNTRLIVLTNLHNPTSNLADLATVQKVVDIAAKTGALVLIDEVYLELTFRPQAATAFTLGDNVVVTSSLTKAYGVSGLRAGWILAQPALAERMRRLNDLFAATPVFMAEQLAAVALDRLPALRARADALLAANYAAWREHLEGHPRLQPSTLPEFGATLFPRLLGGEVDAFAERLRRDHETSVVPGRFFERPEHFRVGLVGDPAMTREGLQRLRAALDAA
jgi:aspartate/methionine/tyrosine aminotransferase